MRLSPIFATLYWIWAASEVGLLIFTRIKRSGSTTTHDRGSLQILWLTIFCAIGAAMWNSHAFPQFRFAAPAWLEPAVVILFAVGLAIRWTAIYQLGKAFTVNVAIQSTQRLNRAGLFGVVRHPSYSGLLLLFLATGLDTHNWIDLAIMLIPTTAALLYRIHVEEAALSGAFGAEYAEYSRTTKRLIPGLY